MPQETPRPDAEAIRRLNELGQLAAGVGHNVINAFSAVVSNAELLRLMGASSRVIDPKVLAETIIRAAMEASGVARRLIDYSRTATSIPETTVHLDRLVREVVDGWRARNHPDIEWVADTSGVPPIRGSEEQLRSMLGHLITNAIEALPPSGGSITLAVARDDRGWIALEVRDTGVGMIPSVQERAVEPFFTTKSGRAGVGLTIAHGIWRRHHGTLAVRSQEGVGTTVRLGIEPVPQHAA